MKKTTNERQIDMHGSYMHESLNKLTYV